MVDLSAIAEDVKLGPERFSPSGLGKIEPVIVWSERRYRKFDGLVNI